MTFQPRVRGRVSNRITTQGLVTLFAVRAGRRVYRTVTFHDARHQFVADVRQARADITGAAVRYGTPVGRELLAQEYVGRAAERLVRPFTVTQRSTDASTPQVHPLCHEHVGDLPIEHPLDEHGVRIHGRGFCPSCKLDVDLEHGRIPAHEPGPPPSVDCPMCGAWLPGFYPELRVENGGYGGAFNIIVCPNCEDLLEHGDDRADRSGWEPATGATLATQAVPVAQARVPERPTSAPWADVVADVPERPLASPWADVDWFPPDP